MLESLFAKAAGLTACNSIKDSSTQVLSSEIFKISKNTFFYRKVPVKELKAGVTINNKYQIQLRKSICCREDQEGATVDVL